MQKIQILQEDIQRQAYKVMLKKLKENQIRYDEEDLKKLTFKLIENVNNELDTIISEAFDPSILDGIDELPPSEIPKMIRSLMGTIRQRKSPFAPIMAISLFFSDNGAKKHSVGAKPVINYLMKVPEISKAVFDINKGIKKLEELLNESGGRGYGIVYDVSYIIDDLTDAVQRLLGGLNKNSNMDWFRGTEAIDGSKDGKRKGLASITVSAAMEMSKLKAFVDTLKGFAEKGKDPMSYWSR